MRRAGIHTHDQSQHILICPASSANETVAQKIYDVDVPNYRIPSNYLAEVHTLSDHPYNGPKATQ